MVAVVAPPLERCERVVERKWRHALDRVYELVEARDLACGVVIAAWPRQHVGQHDPQAETTAVRDDAGEIARGVIDRASLCDVIDAALHDEHFGARYDVVDERSDLIRALAVRRARPELESRLRRVRPPLPLAALVRVRDSRAYRRVRIPERRAGGDRVSDDRDDH